MNGFMTLPKKHIFSTRAPGLVILHETEETMMEKTPSCATCKWRHYTENKPGSLVARLWKWHTGWCPGWKAYQKYLREGGPAKSDPQGNG